MNKPNGYAVVMPDEDSSPIGYWFVGAWWDRATAEEVCARHGRGCRVEQIYFGVQPEGMATRDAIIEECAQAIYKRNEQLCSDPEVCYTEPDTGATVINSRFSDHVEALDEAEAIVRALKQQLPQNGEGAKRD